MALTRQIVWIDAGGRTRVTLPTGNATLSTLMAALQAKSQADVFSWFEGTVTALTPVPAGGVFPDIADLARLTFTDGTGSLVALSLPAPSASIFLADSVTVDSTQIAAIIAAAVGTLLSTAGNPVTAFVAGTRNQRSSNA